MTETMYVVIPCYNEEQMLPITAKALIKKLDELKAEVVSHRTARSCSLTTAQRTKRGR